MEAAALRGGQDPKGTEEANTMKESADCLGWLGEPKQLPAMVRPE
jgi:hypothetical protein